MILHEVHLPDFFILQEHIRGRKTADYLMQAAIARYPHLSQSDAKEFIDSLKANLPASYNEDSDVMDVGALESLKQQLVQQGSNIGAR